MSDLTTSTVIDTLMESTTQAGIRTAVGCPSGSGSSTGINTGDQTSVSGNAGTATKLAASVNIDSTPFDGSANVTVVAPAIHAATSKTTPVDADETPLVDSAASNVLKKLTWANLKATLLTYFSSAFAPATPTSDVDINSNKLINVSNPTNAQDGATKAYVDGLANGLSPKASCAAATTAALPANTYSNGSSGVGATLIGIVSGVLTVDGHTVALNDRILVKNESAQANNGIYICTTAGAIGVAYILTRAADSNTPSEIQGAYTLIELGTTNATTQWANTNSSAPTIGTTAITFGQVGAPGSVTAGNGISVSGNQVSIDTSVTVDKTTAQTLTNKTLTSPTLTAPVLGTPASGNLGNCTSYGGNAGTATTLATPRNIDGTAFDGSANILVVAPAIHASTSKPTPVDADEMSLTDSAASYVLKKLTWANLKATLKTYFDTIYQASGGSSGLPLLYKAGYTLSNDVTSPNTVLDVAVGAVRDSTNAADIILASALTKTTGTWASGTGNGGLDTGTVANSTWYSVFAINNGTSVDCLFSTSATSPSMPSGYTYKRRIGSFLTDASAHILAYTQVGSKFLWSAPPTDVNSTSLSTSAVAYTLTVPTGVKVDAEFMAFATTSAVTAVLISSPDVPDIAPDTNSIFDFIVTTGTTPFMPYPCANLYRRTSTSATIRSRATGAVSTFRIRTTGWTEYWAT